MRTGLGRVFDRAPHQIASSHAAMILVYAAPFPAPVRPHLAVRDTGVVAGSKKTARFDQKKGVRKLARERIGAVPPARPIEPKDKRKKPKHKKGLEEEQA